MKGEQRDELAGCSVERALAADDVNARSADERIDLRARVALRAEEQQCGELVIEPSAVSGQHEDALRAHRGRDVERELEVGGVLLVRMSLDASSGGLRHRDGLRRRGVEVAHRDRHLEAERERVLEPLVRRDDGCAERHSQRRTRIRRLSARHHHDDLFRHAFLRWHYPDQVLRVGGASVRPLSPAARAPRYVSAIVATDTLAA